MKNNIIVSILVTLVVSGGVGFYAGMKYTSSSSISAGAEGGQFQRGGGQGRGGRAAGGMTSGEILSRDSTSLTIQMRDGGSRIVFLSNNTQVLKAAPGTTTDLMSGEQITAIGGGNADGSMTAQTIQIRPKLSGTSTQPFSR